MVVKIFLVFYVLSSILCHIPVVDSQYNVSTNFYLDKLSVYRTKENRTKRAWYSTEKTLVWGTSKEEAMELFNIYYQCLESKIKTLENEKAYNNIHPILALEGQEVKLKCPVCVRSGETENLARVFWQHLQTSTGELKYVEPGSRTKIKEDMTLVLKSVDVIDAGQYFCVRTRDREYENVYQLDVLFREKRLLYKENDHNDFLKVDNRSENNLSVFTKWSEWSNCNTCGKIGQRRKVGLCMVRKLHSGQAIAPEDIPIIDLYPEGIPCRSTVLPEVLQNMDGIRDRKSETVIGECFVDCPTEPPAITVTGANGDVLDTIPAGFYPIGKKPALPPMVIRKVVYEVTKKNIMLQCPVPNADDNTNIRWLNGSKVIDPLTIRRHTRGRVMIDNISRLHIRDLRLYDTAIFHCWLKRWHVAAIKLIVTEAFNHNIKEYITYAGLALTVVCMTLVCFCTCCRRTAQRTR